MTGVELIADIINWKWYLVTLLVHGIAPGLLLRIIVLAFEKEDPRRQELIAELYAVPFVKRPFWVAQQLETATADGLWPRFIWLLTGRIIHRWHLGNGVERNREHPDTFWVPSDDAKAGLATGDLVKLMFETKDWGERMWVRITKIGPNRIEGTLENEPWAIARLTWGHTVKFQRKHIIDIEINAGDTQQVIDAA